MVSFRTHQTVHILVQDSSDLNLTHAVLVHNLDLVLLWGYDKTLGYLVETSPQCSKTFLQWRLGVVVTDVRQLYVGKRERQAHRSSKLSTKYAPYPCAANGTSDIVPR